jgi:hypothetical protein
MSMPDAAVEAAAMAIGDMYGHPPDDYRPDARRALEAALPHLELLEALKPVVVDREAAAGLLHGYAHDVMASRCSGSSVCYLWDLAWKRADAVAALYPKATEGQPACLGDGVCTNPHCPKHGVASGEGGK